MTTRDPLFSFTKDWGHKELEEYRTKRINSLICDSEDSPLVPSSRPPLALRITEGVNNIDPQTNSRLLSLPTEIHNQIIDEVLRIDEDSLTDWSALAPMPLDLAYLRTCKRVYLMTFTLPILTTPLRVSFSSSFNDAYGCSFLKTPPRMWQFTLITSLDITADQSAVQETTAFARLISDLQVSERHTGVLCPSPSCTAQQSIAQQLALAKYLSLHSLPQKITSLTIRISRHSWHRPWFTLRPSRLALDPAQGADHQLLTTSTTVAQMHANANAARQRLPGAEPPVYGNNWGAMVCQSPDLKRFRLGLECEEKEVELLEGVVGCARTWVFGLEGGGGVMRWDGNLEEKTVVVKPGEEGVYSEPGFEGLLGRKVKVGDGSVSVHRRWVSWRREMK